MMIEVKNLYFTYAKNKEKTIKNISFSIDKGEVFGFLGPSGAGKSTTQKIVIGILKKYKGNVRVMGKEVAQEKSDYYEHIGVAFEFPNFYLKFTALENLNFFKSLFAGETENPFHLLSMVGLENDAKTKVSDFSKGMKMRLNFCRAFLNKPNILFLDEPTAGLDPMNQKKIKNIILQQKASGKTIFLTTHNMNVAEDLCDQVAFIVDGKISLIDSPRRLKIDKGRKSVLVEYRQNKHTMSEEFALQKLGHNNKFIELIKNKQIETIHTQEATLEDIFIEVTGRSLS